MTRNPSANKKAYAFWRKKVLEWIDYAEMQCRLAPVVPPQPFGTKRSSLEEGYFEVHNQPNVALVDVKENPIVEITPKSVRT